MMTSSCAYICCMHCLVYFCIFLIARHDGCGMNAFARRLGHKWDTNNSHGKASRSLVGWVRSWDQKTPASDEQV
ncbi:hypothetical protein HZ326_4401 [Fusarium oxysporum f. sp. albedinis]|nr:hypothetical protein HZ326_4401 [Fusarium oxysporum f. sp. albedinis]